jgi:hypothetical protein
MSLARATSMSYFSKERFTGTPRARPVTQDQGLSRFVAALLAFAIVGGAAWAADVPSPAPEKLSLLNSFFEDEV